MTQYLTNLVSRSFGAKPSLYPQVSTLFAPKQADLNASWTLPVEEEKGFESHPQHHSEMTAESVDKQSQTVAPPNVPLSRARTLHPTITAAPMQEPLAAGEQVSRDLPAPQTAQSPSMAKSAATGKEADEPEPFDESIPQTKGPSDRRKSNAIPAVSRSASKAPLQALQSVESILEGGEAAREMPPVRQATAGRPAPRNVAAPEHKAESQLRSPLKPDAPQPGKGSEGAISAFAAADREPLASDTRKAALLRQQHAKLEQNREPEPGQEAAAEHKPGHGPEKRSVETKPLFPSPNAGPGAQRGPRSTVREQQPPPREPVIEVTIGRIEVRASATEERRPRGMQSAPLPSLDEYLRRRSGKSAHE